MMETKRITKDELLKVVARLVGPIEPIGDASYDREAKENLRVLTDFMKDLHIVVDKIATDHKDSPYMSEKEVGLLANEYLNWLGI